VEHHFSNELLRKNGRHIYGFVIFARDAKDEEKFLVCIMTNKGCIRGANLTPKFEWREIFDIPPN
jgi:hypothetical protein